MSDRITSDLHFVRKFVEGTSDVSPDALRRRNKDDVMSSSEIRRFFEMYRSITGQDGLDVCKSAPLEIVLTLLSSGLMVMKDEDIFAAVDAPQENIRRWMKVLVDRGVVSETEHDSRKVYSLSPQCLSQYLVEI